MTEPQLPLRLVNRLSVLSMFTSGATLICCALPATLVAIGSAASLVSLFTYVPQLIWLSAHKPLVFGLAGGLLGLAGLMQWRARTWPCPTDPALAAHCVRSRRQSLWVYAISLLIFLIGCLFAFVAPWLM